MTIAHSQDGTAQTETVQNVTQNWGTPAKQYWRKGNNLVKYTQWEHIDSTNSKGAKIKTKTWKQVDHKETVAKIFDEVADKIPKLIGHVFLNDLQYHQLQKLHHYKRVLFNNVHFTKFTVSVLLYLLCIDYIMTLGRTSKF